MALAQRITAVHEADRTYGASRITAELNDATILGDDGRVNHKRVARVMRERGIAGLRLRRRVRTTIGPQNKSHHHRGAAFSTVPSARSRPIDY